MKTQENIIKKGNLSIEFSDFLQPENLIELSPKYLEHIPVLISYIKNKLNLEVKLLLQRIQPDGSILKREVWGLLYNLNLENKSFEFFTKEDLNGTACEEGFNNHILMKNVLGIIPMIPKTEIFPYKNSNTEITANYFRYLKKMMELMHLCIGTIHKCTITYKYKDGAIKIIECEIVKVNRSNVEMIIHRSMTVKNGDVHPDISVGGFKAIKLNISIEKYLSKVEVIFGEKHEINPRDDGEEF